MTILGQDLRHGIRMLLKNPGFTALAVSTLALGIGANTAIFSVVNAVLLRPLPYLEPGRLMMVYAIYPPTGWLGGGKGPFFDPDFTEYRTQNRVFASLAAFTTPPFNLSGAGAEPERVPGAAATADFFAALGARPALGRTFTEEEDRPGRTRVVLLSDRLWRSRFSADPAVIGRTVRLDGESFTVIGVMPAGFEFPNAAELWAPLTIGVTRDNAFLRVIGRLKPGVRREQAQAEMETIARRLQQEFPKTNAGVSVSLVPLDEEVVGNVKSTLLVFMGAIGFVLLIACANVANLMLARAEVRQRETAIRAALGAGRWRLAQQFLTESLLLSGLGGAAGLVLALWGVDLLVALIPAGSVPRLEEIGASFRPDWRVLTFTFLVSLITGLVFGLAPALKASRGQRLAVSSGWIPAAPRRGVSAPRLLVVSQIALSLVLLIGAGLMIQSFARLRAVRPGFNPQRVLTMNVVLPQSVYRTAPQQKAFYRQALERIEALPGVMEAGTTMLPPLRGQGIYGDFYVEGRPAPPGGLQAGKTPISTGYFRTMGIPLLQGRSFTEGDNAAAPGVAIISENLARRLWVGESPVGKRITLEDRPKPEDWLTIVGVVGDVKQEKLGAPSAAIIYIPYLQVSQPFWLGWASFVVRTATEPAGLAPALRRAVEAVDPDQPVHEIATMEQVVSASIAEPRFQALLLGVFSALALLLAVVGIYGVMAYSVTRRTREIGVRMALGAQRADVLRLVVGEGMALTLLGLGAGVAGALAATRVLASFLFEVKATDAATFAAVSLLLGAAAAAASYIPARRAATVDPMAALRHE